MKTGYCVRITRKCGGTFLAIGANAPTAIFHKRREAVAFKHGLCDNGIEWNRMKVVKVRYSEPEVIG